MRNIFVAMLMLLLSSCGMMTMTSTITTTKSLGTVSVYTDTGEHFATYNAELNRSVSGTESSSPIKLGGILNFYDIDTGNYKLVSGGIIVCDYKTVVEVETYEGNDVNDDLEKNIEELEKNIKELEKSVKNSEYKLSALTLYSRFKENYENIESLPKGSTVRCPISNVEFVKKFNSDNFYNNDCRWLYDACTNLNKYSRPADYKYIVDRYNKINKKYN